MRFVHIVEINDPRHPLLEPLSREQLWRGLLRRVEQPMEFLPQLNGCSIVMRGDRTLVRELDFGAFTVRDRVLLEPMEKMSIVIKATPQVPEGKLIIAIETHSADHLQLRFTYDIQRKRSDDIEMEEQYDRVLQSAYVQADIDSVKIIRSLVDRRVL